ncbi:Ribose import ATP-binding protein RbsA [bioreactor metagenome]|uniref:Ribose import ATP-binding protein RbsA n=1 Tax=bioreactor metagenome TaxID=1076179 RepID=A0A645FAQ7_9ZZZZ
MPDISVERYLTINHEVIWGGFVIDWKETGKLAQEILDRENRTYDRKELLKNLSVSDVQLLEIVRAITIGCISVLIMDEPTSALSEKEVERLFHNIDTLKKRLYVNGWGSVDKSNHYRVPITFK